MSTSDAPVTPPEPADRREDPTPRDPFYRGRPLASDGGRSEAENPLDAFDLRFRVQKVLDDVVARHSRQVDLVSIEIAPVIETISDFLQGGKRLRPAFCYWGWRGAGGPDEGEEGESLIRACSSLELLQLAAIVHDDLMDDSPYRRGLPTVHRRFAALHRGAGWGGSADRFGRAAAVLIGDLCLCWSDELYTSSGLPFDALSRGRPVFDSMRTELMAGQYLDLMEQMRVDLEGSAAERVSLITRFKSARYTVEHPLLLGGFLADASADLLRVYSEYAAPLGEAFQLVDDVLSAFGGPAQTGKREGDDFREGKRTLLVALAYDSATPAEKFALRKNLGDSNMDASQLTALRQVIVDTGALSKVRSRIQVLLAQASEALDDDALGEPTRSILRALVAKTAGDALSGVELLR